MTDARSHAPSRARQQWMVAIVIAAGLALVSIALVAGAVVGYRINMTPSEPLGVWRIRPLQRPPAIGDLVFICPPETEAFSEARMRGYLRSGVCPTGDAPLIKMVIAIEGQRIEIGADVRIDGLRIPQTTIVPADGKGRPLHGDAGGIVPAGQVFLYSPFKASWDSRYFGSIPAAGILGLAEEVLTHAP